MAVDSRRCIQIDELAALEMLRAGRPRRCRAILRLLARRPVAPPRYRLVFLDAVALFWEGAFERAIARAALANAMSNGQLGVMPIALEIECLLFAERSGEARRLFDAQAERLKTQSWHGHGVSSAAMLEAMLRFHEGDVEGCCAGLDHLLRKPLDETDPTSRVIHFYTAAVAHKQGQSGDARSRLEKVMRGGKDLFLASWAADTHAELFSGDRANTAAPVRPNKPHASGARTVAENLKRGLGILFFRRSALEGAAYDYEAMVLLVLVNLLCAGLICCLDFTPEASFLADEAITLAGAVPLFTITAYIVTRGLRASGIAVSVAGAFYSALPTLLVLDFAAYRLSRHWQHAVVLEVMLAGWALAVVLFLVRHLTRGGFLRLLASAVIFGASWLAPMFEARQVELWLEFRGRESFEDNERKLGAFLFAQADQVHVAETQLAPERPSIEDLYFVGFAGWGEQDVFLNEVTAARKLFDERFDTSERSLILANDLSTRKTLPMATKLNLGHVLKVVGERMNPEEDILFLFLTSHGSQTGLGLTSSSHPALFSEHQITPAELRSLLDETRIKWRVVVVSGCESGVFIAPLQDDFTLVATASASDRSSFGCEGGRQFTEYGRALFGEQLVRERSFVTALNQANATVAEREKERALTPSLPQVSVGSAIAGKLRSLESRLADAGR